MTSREGRLREGLRLMQTRKRLKRAAGWGTPVRAAATWSHDPQKLKGTADFLPAGSRSLKEQREDGARKFGVLKTSAAPASIQKQPRIKGKIRGFVGEPPYSGRSRDEKKIRKTEGEYD